MFISKQTVSVSSDTANWTAKRAAVGVDINGALLEIHISPGASTDTRIKLFRGTTQNGNLVMDVIPGTTSYTWRPKGMLTVDSTATPVASTQTAGRHAWPFANERPTVVMGGTAKSFTLSLYVDGNTSSG
jgi:hypothetical protein